MIIDDLAKTTDRGDEHGECAGPQDADGELPHFRDCQEA